MSKLVVTCLSCSDNGLENGKQCFEEISSSSPVEVTIHSFVFGSFYANIMLNCPFYFDVQIVD